MSLWATHTHEKRKGPNENPPIPSIAFENPSRSNVIHLFKVAKLRERLNAPTSPRKKNDLANVLSLAEASEAILQRDPKKERKNGVRFVSIVIQSTDGSDGQSQVTNYDAHSTRPLIGRDSRAISRPVPFYFNAINEIQCRNSLVQ